MRALELYGNIAKVVAIHGINEVFPNFYYVSHLKKKKKENNFN